MVVSWPGIAREDGRKRPYVPAISLRLARRCVSWRGLPGQAHWCPARFVLDEVHGIDSIGFQLVANHLDTKRDQRRAAPEYRFSWDTEACSVGARRSACGEIRCRW